MTMVRALAAMQEYAPKFVHIAQSRVVVAIRFDFRIMCSRQETLHIEVRGKLKWQLRLLALQCSKVVHESKHGDVQNRWETADLGEARRLLQAVADRAKVPDD